MSAAVAPAAAGSAGSGGTTSSALDDDEPLAKRQCIPCVKNGGDLQLLSPEEVAEGMRGLDPLWSLIEGGKVTSQPCNGPQSQPA